MKSTTALLFVVGAFVSTQSASATPTYVGPGTRIVDNTTSQAFPDTRAPKRLWVLPPVSGKAGQGRLSMETPESECDSLKNFFQAAKLYSAQILILAHQRSALLATLGELADKKSQRAEELYAKTQLLNQDIISAKNSVDELISDNARRHGGTLNIPYVTKFAANINKIKKENPSYPDVRPVETFHARLYFSVPDSVQDGLDVSLLPVIRTYSIAGVKASNLAKSPAQVANKIDVTLSLTEIGACIMRYPQKFGVTEAPKFGMTLIYDYPFVFTTKVTASYNLKSIYHYLKTTGSSGGLFTSRTWTKTVESNWGAGAIKFHWAQSDPDSTINASQRFKIESSIKSELLSTIDQLILTKANVGIPKAQNPGPHGAIILSQQIDKTCAANEYCAAASIALRTLNAIFGSSSMSAELDKKLDLTATYTLDNSAARYVSQGVSYNAD